MYTVQYLAFVLYDTLYFWRIREVITEQFIMTRYNHVPIFLRLYGCKTSSLALDLRENKIITTMQHTVGKTLLVLMLLLYYVTALSYSFLNLQ